MKFTFLGNGTSHGVPVIGCECKVCKSRNKKDKRFRCSAHILSQNGTSVIIDLSPEFRLQAVRSKIKEVDAILITHIPISLPSLFKSAPPLLPGFMAAVV